MIKPASKFDFQEIKKAVSKLSLKQRIKLMNELEKDLFPHRFRAIVRKLRSKAKTASYKQITQVAEEVRKKLYEEEIKNRH